MFKSFSFALQLLTRIRIYQGNFDEFAFGKATTYFPIVGFMLGLILWTFKIILDLVFPPPLVAALLVIIVVCMTGGLHLDGFMDTIDGIFSGRSRERKLEIMKDSRVGAFGAVGLVCLLLVKYNVFLTTPGNLFFKSITISMLLSRWGMVYSIVKFPYARKEGLGTLFKNHTGNKELYIATLTTMVITSLVAGPAGVLMFCATWTWVYFMGSRVTADLGGLTGDVFGAAAETTEILIYLLALIIFKYLPYFYISVINFA